MSLIKSISIEADKRPVQDSEADLGMIVCIIGETAAGPLVWFGHLAVEWGAFGDRDPQTVTTQRVCLARVGPSGPGHWAGRIRGRSGHSAGLDLGKKPIRGLFE